MAELSTNLYILEVKNGKKKIKLLFIIFPNIQSGIDHRHLRSFRKIFWTENEDLCMRKRSILLKIHALLK